MKVKFDYNQIGKEVFRSPEMESQLREIAMEAASSLGDGYAYDTKLMATRYVASVYTATDKAYRDNMKNNTLARLV